MLTPIRVPSPQETPARPVGTRYLVALGIAQFGIFIAILSPVFVSMQLKAQELNPTDPASVLGVVLPIGALGALVGNPLFGALSDNTRTRWGRRRPWLVGGILALLLGLGLVGLASNIVTLTVAWLLCQLASNAASSALIASFADNVPRNLRGRASSVFALAQNISILAGTYGAVLLVQNLPLLFLLPGLIGVVCVVIYVLATPETLPEAQERQKVSLRRIAATFWTNPVAHRDFAFAWWSRFLITLATFMFTTYRLLYMQDHIGLDASAAVLAVANGVLLYTIALFVGTAVSGWLSDKLHRRKIFVGGSTLLYAVGLITLASADTVGMFYIAEIILGLAYGVYAAIDVALVMDVLPDPEKPGKDLGVINIANSIPQSLAPALGAALLGTGGGQNYPVLLWGAGIVAVIGAIVVIPIKNAR